MSGLKVMMVIWTAMSNSDGWHVAPSRPEMVDEGVCADLKKFYAERSKPFHGIGPIRITIDCVPITNQALAKSE